jgi:N-acetylmuramoyl-L-alanine amidase
MTADHYDSILTALCIYREARGESREAKRGVYHVVANRTRDKRWPRIRSEVILQPGQFASFMPGDPNATVMPHWNDAAWQECCAVVDDPGADPTGGANHYHSIPESKPQPKWAAGRTPCAVIGPFKFFRL